MGSVSVSSLILFIAALGVAAAVSGVMVNSVSGISQSIDEHSLDVTRQIDSDIEIISDPGSNAIYNNSTNTTTLLVKNTGSRTLEHRPAEVDVLLDGQYISPSALNTTVIGGGHWTEGDVLRIEVTEPLGSGEHRAVVIVNKDREVLRFYL